MSIKKFEDLVYLRFYYNISLNTEKARVRKNPKLLFVNNNEVAM